MKVGLLCAVEYKSMKKALLLLLELLIISSKLGSVINQFNEVSLLVC